MADSMNTDRKARKEAEEVTLMDSGDEDDAADKGEGMDSQTISENGNIIHQGTNVIWFLFAVS